MITPYYAARVVTIISGFDLESAVLFWSHHGRTLSFGRTFGRRVKRITEAERINALSSYLTRF